MAAPFAETGRQIGEPIKRGSENRQAGLSVAQPGPLASAEKQYKSEDAQHQDAQTNGWAFMKKRFNFSIPP
jgi:hypothetical protein